MESLIGPIVVVTGPSGAGKSTVGRLVAEAMDSGVHLPIDDFESFIVSGRAEPDASASTPQNRAVGGAVFAAGLQYALGGFTVVVDGFVFPEVLRELAAWIEATGVALHYAVLRPDLATCAARRPGAADGTEAFARLHARFDDLGEYESHVIDHSGSPEAIADRVVTSLATERLRVRGQAGNDDEASLIDIELGEDERFLLRCGLVEWGGPARCTDELAIAMGFASVTDLFANTDRLLDAVEHDRPMSRNDWFRVVLATEIVFASDLVGSGIDWQATTGLTDAETVRILRSVQRRVTPHLH